MSKLVFYIVLMVVGASSFAAPILTISEVRLAAKYAKIMTKYSFIHEFRLNENIELPPFVFFEPERFILDRWEMGPVVLDRINEFRFEEDANLQQIRQSMLNIVEDLKEGGEGLNQIIKQSDRSQRYVETVLRYLLPNENYNRLRVSFRAPSYLNLENFHYEGRLGDVIRMLKEEKLPEKAAAGARSRLRRAMGGIGLVGGIYSGVVLNLLGFKWGVLVMPEVTAGTMLLMCEYMLSHTDD